jgi:hypothetical protein
MRLMNDLYRGLPTEMVRKLEAEVEKAIAEQVCKIEPILPSLDGVLRFCNVLSSPRAPNVLVVAWKRFAIVRVTRTGGRQPRVKIETISPSKT